MRKHFFIINVIKHKIFESTNMKAMQFYKIANKQPCAQYNKSEDDAFF